MIVSKRLCFISLPKTGGRFVRKYLTENVPHARSYKHAKGVHDPIGRLEKSDSNLSVIGTVRNPLSWYVSFFFDNRRMTPVTIEAAEKAGRKTGPTTLMKYFDPNKSGSFLVFLNNIYDEIESGNPPRLTYNSIDLDYETMRKYDIGILTMIYMYMFFPEYDQIVQQGEDIFNLHDDLFGLDYTLNQDTLNTDLVNVLNELYPEKDGFEIQEKYFNINVTKREHWTKYYTDDLIEKVRYKERMIFDKYIFAEVYN